MNRQTDIDMVALDPELFVSVVMSLRDKWPPDFLDRLASGGYRFRRPVREAEKIERSRN